MVRGDGPRDLDLRATFPDIGLAVLGEGEAVKTLLHAAGRVAAVGVGRGAAAGAGMNLALACDMRIASDKAVFVESFVKIGLIPDWGGFDFLTKLVGTSKAMELMMLGDRIDASEAHQLGLVNRVVPDETFRDEAAKLARRLADGPVDGAFGEHKNRAFVDLTGDAELACAVALNQLPTGGNNGRDV